MIAAGVRPSSCVSMKRRYFSSITYVGISLMPYYAVYPALRIRQRIRSHEAKQAGQRRSSLRILTWVLSSPVSALRTEVPSCRGRLFLLLFSSRSRLRLHVEARVFLVIPGFEQRRHPMQPVSSPNVNFCRLTGLRWRKSSLLLRRAGVRYARRNQRSSS